jgi:ABC-type lipoprotein release transport system permease subunit
MPYYLSMAFKNIFRDWKRSFTLGINYLIIALLLFILFSVTQGVKKNITENVVSSAAGHITVSGEYIIKGRTFQGIKDQPGIRKVIEDNFPGVRILTRYNISSAVYYKGVSKRLSFVGVDAAQDLGLRDQIDIYQGSWDSFADQPNAVIMSKSVADYFGLADNDEVLISTRSRFGAFNTGTVQIRGLYKSGNYFIRDLVISHFGYLQSLDLADGTTASKMFIFFPRPDGITAKRALLMNKLESAGYIALKPANSSEALNAVSAASPRYKVVGKDINQIRLTLATIDEVTGIVSQVVAAINGLGLFIAAIMLFIIAVSIFINMRMTINDRMQEIGTLRAIGSEQDGVTALFIAENVFLCMLFVTAGMILGWIVSIVFATLVRLPADGVLGLFLNRGHFVMQPTLPVCLFILGTLSLFTAAFSFFPARYGSRIPPVVALNKTN